MSEMHRTDASGGGIFCANFGVPVIGLALCHWDWCAPCYQQKPGTSFLVYQGIYPDTITIPNEDIMYLQARPDSIYLPFGCDECSFYCVAGSLSQHDNCAHKNLLDYIRNTNLDDFWSRTQVTLYHITRMFYEEVTTGQNLGFQISRNLAQASWCIKEFIQILLQSLMKT